MIKLSKYQSGKWIKQLGYKAFIPSLINQEWLLDDPELNDLLAEANLKLGELNAFGQLVPNIDFFILMHKTKEATTSSRIEGTMTNMVDSFLQKDAIKPEQRGDWQEVQNYIAAMNDAIEALRKLPISNRLIKRTHKILMQGVRGKHKQPGSFRKSQNWIGGASIKDATFIPPPQHELANLMSDLEKFLHNEDIHVPALIRIGIVHYQFETIHPFLDGNGRVGRLLITLYLVSKGMLLHPALYISDFFNRNRNLYYENLNKVRTKNDMLQWLKFFMVGIIETSHSSIQTFNNILTLKSKIEKDIVQLKRKTENAKKLLQYLFQQPIVNTKKVQELLDVSAPTANSLLKDFVRLGILKEKTGYLRNRIFEFEVYLNLFKGAGNK